MSSLKLNLDYKLLMIEGERTLLNDEIQKKGEEIQQLKEQFNVKFRETNDLKKSFSH